MRFLRVLRVMLTVSVSLLAADSPFSETWKLNPAKGHPLPPLAKSIVAQVPPGTDEKVGNGRHLLLELRTVLSEELLR
jgi:hypothetical protein